jgi:methyltransferase (TIGR00027 family)
MQEGKASQTALMVTAFRAWADAGVTTVPGFSDPTAKHFLSGFWLKRYELAARNPKSMRAAFARPAGDLLALRTLMIDGHVRDAVEKGARQLVILGAGFDGRAHRMKELAQVDVFEVDHPATQAAKTLGAVKLPLMAHTLVRVPVDFEKDSLDTALEVAGHRKREPTIWVWEGVVMYLSDEALRSTLRTIGPRSAAGSTLIIQYNSKTQVSLLNVALRFWREPMIGLRHPKTMSAELGEVGFDVLEDLPGNEWSDRYGGEPLTAGWGRRSRILCARRL